jgi:hypothetical protein
MADKKILVRCATGFVSRSLFWALNPSGYTVPPTCLVEPSRQPEFGYFVSSKISVASNGSQA